jgi:hypothetical protein
MIFNDFKSAFNWVDKKVKNGVDKSIEEIAEKAYKDSEKYTYIDTGDMYKSGNDSDFKKGYVLIKAPQVRWLYYTMTINAGPGNRMAVPQWFEATKLENMTSYKQLLSKNIEKG